MDSETVEIGSEVKERPILFTGEMVRAILDGRKTQTRRVVKPQPDPSTTHFGVLNGVEHWACNGDPCDIDSVGISDDCSWACPYGVPGDRLWVRETWGLVDPDTCDENVRFRTVEGPDGADRHVVYAATGDLHEWNIEDGDEYDSRGRRRSCWRPSIHMPRWASRLLLEVTEVRVERVQEISRDDAVAEGVDWQACPRVPMPSRYGRAVCREKIDYVGGFRTLWDSINAARGFGWTANPWVWVVTFKLVNPDPISQTPTEKE